MKAIKKAKPQPLPVGWVVTERVRSESGRWIEPGTELTVQGIRGRVKFVKHVKVMAEGEVQAEWIDVIDRHSHFRSVRPEKIKTVHWTKKLRGSA